MKFLCDRCKTRYSIGDDRVRGKILKIRCKNCANVITVREGMTDADAAEPAGPSRRLKQTTMAPLPTSSTPATGTGALGAAFQSAMTTAPAPSALEEEWYVSNDGEQEGPFSLAEAQRWVSTKAFDADLHCWSEGFDDWLPVDKVSHFRGLRKKPLPPGAPPPLPRLGTGPSRVLGAAAASSQPAPVEDEPKPLFAATMASLERNAPAPSSPALAVAPLNGSALRPSATPAGGHVPMPVSPVSPSSPTAVPKLNGNGAAARSQPVRSAITPAPTATGPVVAKPAPVPAFDVGDSATQIESAPFDLEDAAPAAGARGTNDAFLDAMAGSRAAAKAAASAPAAPATRSLKDLAATAPVTPELDDDDGGDLQIGEVSRVVNLADLMKNGGSRSTGQKAAIAQRRSGPIATGPLAQRATGAMASMPAGSGTGSRTALGANGLAPGTAADPGAFLDPSHELGPGQPPPVSHRRGMIALIAVAGLLLGAAVIFFVLMAQKDDSFDSGLRGGGTIDTTRPDDITHRAGGDTAVTGPTNPFTGKPITPTRPRNPNTNVTPHKDPTEVKQPDGLALRPDEIEAEAAKRSTSTQRCYMRSQKGADAILIGDVKKIAVTLTVDRAGSVTDVSLSEHGNDSLGKCLISAIRAWRFRESSAGITAKITMVFQSG